MLKVVRLRLGKGKARLQGYKGAEKGKGTIQATRQGKASVGR